MVTPCHQLTCKSLQDAIHTNPHRHVDQTTISESIEVSVTCSHSFIILATRSIVVGHEIVLLFVKLWVLYCLEHSIFAICNMQEMLIPRLAFVNVSWFLACWPSILFGIWKRPMPSFCSWWCTSHFHQAEVNVGKHHNKNTWRLIPVSQSTVSRVSPLITGAN